MRNLLIPVILLILGFSLTVFSQEVHHELYVGLDVEGSSIEVIDSITIPRSALGGSNYLAFSLNNNLLPASSDPAISLRRAPGLPDGSMFSTYQVVLEDLEGEEILIPLVYSGMIREDITTGADEYARGFSETSGIISESGVYLAGSTYWVPVFNDLLVTFDMTVRLRSDWNVVSQGERLVNKVNGEVRTVSYHAEHPTEEVYLISAGWTEYGQMAGEVLVQAFLRTPDSALAYRYIGATAAYLDMFTRLIGPYPYSKFALVENFWETGFGMPSFTLLGEKIIRFPWILSTSYPHELLHNWWGNSVYVSFENGNWCEGLTAYMADHMLKEQSGQGEQYRRETLQKFTDYVNAENDFPLISFRSRNNPAEEAIGYGKCLMFNHMLRKEVGDEKFRDAYRRFYGDNIFRVAGFDDIQTSFSQEVDADLVPFFEQWLLRKGAPSLKLEDVEVVRKGDGYHLGFSLLQVQDEDPFALQVPVAVYFDDQVVMKEVIADGRSAAYSFEFQEKPVKIVIDPRFDVFRRLDKAEVPPTLSQVFGSEDALIILPGNSPFLEDYRMLAETWQKTQEAQDKKLQIMLDTDLEELPVNATAWIIGFENKFFSLFSIDEKYGQTFSADQKELVTTLGKEGSLVYAVPGPGNNSFTLGFVGTNVKAAVPGLTRLLTHYGKYSFLGFEGERPNNVLKGNFPAISSPLSYSIPYQDELFESSATLEPEKALID